MSSSEKKKLYKSLVKIINRGDREQMKVTVKEWRVMSDHNKQLLLKAVATK